MASAYNITTYRDPEKLDISLLGKAATYQQQNYDQNVAQVQQLVNQYAGTDLMKDVDKEYFGQRLNTIVQFINESGTRSWGKKSTSNAIQSYVSSALDENVINAIGSTKRYQNQMAKIEEIKKSKPELWSSQNQEYATQDLKRYLSSEQVGDIYQARDYINYKDVQKHILDNAKLLKEYGVEYKFEPVGGNAYFTRIGKKERIEPETAREFLNLMLTPEMQTQLSIDGWYTYKDVEEPVLQEKYQSRLDANLDYANDRKAALNLELASASGSKKKEIQAQIAKLDQFSSDISDKKQQKLDRNNIINNLYINDFYDKNTSFLSYDRIVDSFVDDSGFQIAKFDHTVKTDNWNMQQKANEFNYKTQQDQIDNALKNRELGLKEKTAGLIYDPSTGEYIADPNAINTGLIATDVVGNPDTEELPDGFVQAEVEQAMNSEQMNSQVVADIQKILSDKSNAKLKGEINGRSARQLAWDLVNSPSKTTALRSLLSPESATIVDKTRSSTSALNSVKPELESMRKDAEKMVYALESPNTKPDSKKLIDFANNGYTIDQKGNVVKGSSMGNRKDDYARAAKMVGVYNSVLAQGNLTPSKEAKLKRLILTEIRSVKENGKPINATKANDIYNKMVFQQKANGFLDTLGHAVMASPLGVVAEGFAGVAQAAGNLFTDSADPFKFGDEFSKYRNEATFGQYNTRGITDRVRSQYIRDTRYNEDISSLGETDIDTKRLGFTPDQMRTRWNTNMDAMSTKLNDYTYSVNKAVNVSLASKAGQGMLPGLQAVLPVGTNIEKDSNIQLVIDQKTGLANITASVKNGKDYEVQTFEGINMTNLPPQIMNTIKVEDQNKVYSANNPHAVPYQASVELDDTLDDYRSKIEYMPERQRYEAMQNPPVTKEDVLSRFKSVYGEELVSKNAEAINKIINTPIDVSTEAVGGKWSIVARQNNVPIFMSPPKDEIYNRDLIGKQSEALVIDLIQESITKVLSKK